MLYLEAACLCTMCESSNEYWVIDKLYYIMLYFVAFSKCDYLLFLCFRQIEICPSAQMLQF